MKCILRLLFAAALLLVIQLHCLGNMTEQRVPVTVPGLPRRYATHVASYDAAEGKLLVRVHDTDAGRNVELKCFQSTTLRGHAGPTAAVQALQTLFSKPKPPKPMTDLVAKYRSEIANERSSGEDVLPSAAAGPASHFDAGVPSRAYDLRTDRTASPIHNVGGDLPADFEKRSPEEQLKFRQSEGYQQMMWHRHRGYKEAVYVAKVAAALDRLDPKEQVEHITSGLAELVPELEARIKKLEAQLSRVVQTFILFLFVVSYCINKKMH